MTSSSDTGAGAATPLTRLTLGTAQLGMSYGAANTRGHLTEAEAHRLLDAALEHGVRSLDTAPAYGEAEARIGTWRRARPAAVDVRVTTKLARLPPDISRRDLDAHVARMVEASLARLGADRVDFLLLHDPADLRRFGDDLVSALLALRERGLVGGLGLSTYTPDDVALLLATPHFDALQVPLNLLDRRLVDSGLLGELARRDIVVFARSAYLQGTFALTPALVPPRLEALRPWLEALARVTKAHGVEPQHIALAWCARQAGVTSVVVGAETVEQIVANTRSLDATIPAALEAALAAAFMSVPVDAIDPSRWPPSPPSVRPSSPNETPP